MEMMDVMMINKEEEMAEMNGKRADPGRRPQGQAQPGLADPTSASSCPL